MTLAWVGLSDENLFACEKPNCYYRVALTDNSTSDHRCPHIGPAHYGWSITVTLVGEMWTLLDTSIDGLKDPASLDREWHSTRARAQCECIAIFMTPHFRTADEVGKEAMRRWKARQEGDTQYETAGLGSLRYQPPPGVDKYARAPKDKQLDDEPAKVVTRRDRQQSPAKGRVKEGDKAGIKAALESKMFTAAELAVTYNVSVTEINSVGSV